ncbi:MAG: hypothetical protein U5R06_14665 [candidate division KSB1 bacterium]|nr:hypothetical protein [candidate division KSB1 bacterium]
MLIVKDIYKGSCIRTKNLRGRRPVETQGLLSAVVYEAQVTMTWDSENEHWVLRHTGRRLTKTEPDKDKALEMARTWNFPEWHDDRETAEQEARERLAERIRERQNRSERTR